MSPTKKARDAWRLEPVNLVTFLRGTRSPYKMKSPASAGHYELYAVATIVQSLGYVDPGLTASGKQTRVVTAITIGHVDPDIMRIDRIVADLPGTYYIAIHRRYRWLQPDRIAASQLHMDRDDYTNKANSALEYITERLNYGGDRV